MEAANAGVISQENTRAAANDIQLLTLKLYTLYQVGTGVPISLDHVKIRVRDLLATLPNGQTELLYSKRVASFGSIVLARVFSLFIHYC